VRLVWSERALSEAREATDYIADARPLVAVDWLHELFERVEGLLEFPEHGRILPEGDRDDLRELIHNPYRVIYQVREDVVEILLLRHVRRDRLQEQNLEGLD
jgi:plasmid stabilization system protein ParE